MIVSIGPYFNHSGQTGPAGPVEGTPYDPTGAAGPSSRFYDFVNGAHLMERGYTYVMVDLRGFGGSSGCLDWGGPGEQSDVKAAVEWAAQQPWSTGKVGMYGKSYDGVTGLMGIAQQPRGSPPSSPRSRSTTCTATCTPTGCASRTRSRRPRCTTRSRPRPARPATTLAYNLNGAYNTARPGCLALNYLDQQSDDHDSSYWRVARPDRRRRRARPTPLFLTQGFIENNTKPDGAWDLFNGVTGPKRAWFGMWDHVRGNDVDANGRLLMGRQGWFDEIMRFFDRT